MSIVAALRTGPRRTTAGLAAVVVLVLAGCSEPGQVNDYNEDVQANFMESCRSANEEADGDEDVEDVEDLCGCWWDAIVEEYSFDEFRALDSEMRDQINDGELTSPEDLRREHPRFADVVASCQVQGPEPPA